WLHLVGRGPLCHSLQCSGLCPVLPSFPTRRSSDLVSVSDHKTISVGVPTELVRGDVFFWQSLMAAAVIVAIPVAVVYSFFLDRLDRKSTRLNSSHVSISYAVFCLKKKKYLILSIRI